MLFMWEAVMLIYGDAIHICEHGEVWYCNIEIAQLKNKAEQTNK